MDLKEIADAVYVRLFCDGFVGARYSRISLQDIGSCRYKDENSM